MPRLLLTLEKKEWLNTAIACGLCMTIKKEGNFVIFVLTLAHSSNGIEQNRI
jgi:hypothetical protein